MLPRDEVGNPIELEELQDTGRHQYVFVVSSNSSKQTDMNGIASANIKNTYVFEAVVSFVT